MANMTTRSWLFNFILVISVLGYALFCTPLQPGQQVYGQSTTVITVTPANSDVILNNNRTVTLYVTDAVLLNAFDIKVTYDSTKLSLASWSYGTLLSNLGTVVLQNNAGSFRLVATQLARPGVTGSGLLVNLTFTGLAYGTSPITVENAEFSSSPPPQSSFPTRQSGSLSVVNALATFTATGTFTLQGRSNAAGVPVTLNKLLTFGPFSGVTGAQSSNNLSISPVNIDLYRITTNQARYLNVAANLNKLKTIAAGSTAITPLTLKGGNAVWTDNVIDTLDLALVAGSYGQTGSNLPGDLNSSGKIDILDLTLVGGNYGLTSAVAYQSWTP